MFERGISRTVKYFTFFALVAFVFISDYAISAMRFENASVEDTMEEIKIMEYDHVTVCNVNVSVDSLWISEGVIRADMAYWNHPGQKPMEGGYREGDGIEFSKGCTYYVKEIKKYGTNEMPGYVVLSRSKPYIPPRICPEKDMFESTVVAHLGDIRFGVASYGKKLGITIAPIKITLGKNTEIKLREGSILWVGSCAYRLEEIKERKDENDDIIFVRVNEFLSKDSIPPVGGEEINKPPPLYER